MGIRFVNPRKNCAFTVTTQRIAKTIPKSATQEVRRETMPAMQRQSVLSFRLLRNLQRRWVHMDDRRYHCPYSRLIFRGLPHCRCDMGIKSMSSRGSLPLSTYLTSTFRGPKPPFVLLPRLALAYFAPGLVLRPLFFCRHLWSNCQTYLNQPRFRGVFSWVPMPKEVLWVTMSTTRG